jgi:hypothetical protein
MKRRADHGIENNSAAVIRKWMSVKAHNASKDETDTVDAIENVTQSFTISVDDLNSTLFRNASAVLRQIDANRISEASAQHQNRHPHIANHTSADNGCQAKLFEPQISYQGIDTLAGTLDRPAGDAAACCRACLGSPPCTHWTWFDNGCSLKHGQLAPITMPPEVISGRVPLDVRIERLRVPPDPNVPRSKVPCFRDEEDEPFFNADPPPR